jgi:NADP-dependent 3-hydroxy acid dehydrogenase YdfG
MPAESRSLKGTVVAITGASSGIGRETARLLVQAGAKVSLGARRLDRLNALVEELGSDDALAVEMDVTSVDDNNEFVAKTLDRFGRLDSMVSNAGVGHYGGISEISDADVANMINVNFTGSVWTVRAAIPEFRRAGGGDVVIVSSVAGLRGGVNQAIYGGTKYAQVGLAECLNRELTSEGIRVTAICPAGTSTEFAIGAGRTEGDPALEDFLRPSDIAFQIVTVLQQPRRMRTTLWASWPMAQW